MQPEHTGFCRYPRIDLTDGKDPLLPTPLGGVTLTTIARWFYTTEEHIERCLAAGITVSEMFEDLAFNLKTTADTIIENMTNRNVDKLPWQQALLYLHYVDKTPQRLKGVALKHALSPTRYPELQWKPRFDVKEWPKGALPNPKARETRGTLRFTKKAPEKSVA